ncbi:MAG: PA2169 family four-helix-bundle protein, partial [Sinobacteraceae bacterium]|nr:PA2169 family four-helix-bundle protein [Nevskiaceae bacterium]
MYYRHAITALGELLAALQASEQRFLFCAAHARNEALAEVLRARVGRCRGNAARIAELIDQLGGNPQAPGLSRRGAAALRADAGADNPEDHALIELAERGEDHTLEVYRNALDDYLPELVRQVLLRQFEDVMS